MGGMMTSGSSLFAWTILLILLAAALTAAGGVVRARVLRARHTDEARLSKGAESRAVEDAQAALRTRYARGEITREDYLQGKVELED